jgi:hypothetical protein
MNQFDKKKDFINKSTNRITALVKYFNCGMMYKSGDAK